MSRETDRASIVTQVEAAKTAWNGTGSFQLVLDYSNRAILDLAQQTVPYLAVDIVWLDAAQMDLGRAPLIGDMGQIMLAAGNREGEGEGDLVKLLDYFRPYLQLRDDLGRVRTRVAKQHAPRRAMGFYYLPMVIDFWTITP